MKKLLCVCYVCSVSIDCTGFSHSVKNWRHEFSSFFYFFVLVLFNLAIVNIAGADARSNFGSIGACLILRRQWI